MNDWAYTLCPMRTRQLVNPHASMEVPVADLKWAPGGKGSKGGILSTYTGRSSCNSGRRRCLLVLNTSHHLAPLEYAPRISTQSYILYFPPSPLTFTVAPSCLNCHWGSPSSTCSSPEVSPVAPSGSESIERLAISSVS